MLLALKTIKNYVFLYFANNATILAAQKKFKSENDPELKINLWKEINEYSMKYISFQCHKNPEGP